jgi:ferredoxin
MTEIRPHFDEESFDFAPKTGRTRRQVGHGLENHGTRFAALRNRGLWAYALGAGLTGFYVLLYWFPQPLAPLVRAVDPLARALSVAPADRWFLYGLLYTLAVLGFGVRMLRRHRGNRYQELRTWSVMSVQLGLAFLLPQWLKAMQQPEYYFSYFWPLKPDYLQPWNLRTLWSTPGSFGVFMVLWGVGMSLLATPILTYFYGKRWYCSWVCGCGGLAETLGDPFRHLSSKSRLSWRLERGIVYGVLVLIALITAALWINAQSDGRYFGSSSGRLAKWYGFYVGALFSGVVGVGFYPILGSRVWCRFGCPMAAVLGVWQRFFSRFRITTNGAQCIGCGNCSTYCEMGIDVRSYAQREANIVRASCVGCGVCAAVCPRGVLRLENGDDYRDRYPGSERPLDALLDSLRGRSGMGTT